MVYGKISTNTVGVPFIYAAMLSQFFCLILISTETLVTPPLAVAFSLKEFIIISVWKLGICNMISSSLSFDIITGD